ncbi:glycosyltransferase family 4 protein [Fulvivirga ligni]|uniref:glycosyltransferase family 4 protein n=1 Tax=Fulvivirga ligni TaxID=2904246 RepID=UPI001F3F7434|nr:glycosyltransferase family 4 protein [Fulvivirga ligni]UII19816.1 glycosyltransferase family 4 protein [Fulvivirga ligni]
MNVIKVLMLGPGEPTALNSGLGIATQHIAEYLKSQVELTIIHPGENIETKNSYEIRNVDTSKFEDVVVSRDIARISITSKLTPYFYSGGSSTPEEIEIESVVRAELKSFTAEVISASKKLEFDVIYAHDWTTIPSALEIKEATNKPLIIHIHSLDYDRNPSQSESWIFDIEKKGLLAADHVIAVSQYTSDVLTQHYQVPEHKIAIVHNAIDSREFDQVQKVFSEKMILFVGRLTGQKGPSIFMQIAAKVHEQMPDTRFVMAGSGELLKQLIETGAYRSVSGKFHFTGQVDHEKMNELYARCDIYCMPSISEPFGLSALEAASMGLPVVLSKQSGAAEVLPAAFTADYWEVNEFVEHIITLLKDKKVYEKSVKDNQDAIHQLTWQKAADSIFEIMKKVID